MKYFKMETINYVRDKPIHTYYSYHIDSINFNDLQEIIERVTSCDKFEIYNDDTQ